MNNIIFGNLSHRHCQWLYHLFILLNPVGDFIKYEFLQFWLFLVYQSYQLGWCKIWCDNQDNPDKIAMKSNYLSVCWQFWHFLQVWVCLSASQKSRKVIKIIIRNIKVHTSYCTFHLKWENKLSYLSLMLVQNLYHDP